MQRAHHTDAKLSSKPLALLIALCLAAAFLGFCTKPPAAHAQDVVHGLAPLPNGASVPDYDRPPGAELDDGPSEAIFPPQTLTIRFNHAKHVKTLKLSCTTCHDKAKTSKNSADSLLPAATRCDSCHGTDHRDLSRVTTDSTEPIGQCGFCHRDHRPEHGNLVRRQHIPKPNLKFDHALHLSRNIQCAQCHGAVENIELATRDQLPRMRGCFTCHQMPAPASGKARGECETCHLLDGSRHLQTSFPSGELVPPTWLHNSGHGPDWIERHKLVAGDDSAFCANCHTEKYCADCHDGRVRPRRVHPNDWLSMHPVSARQNSPNCTSCHREQSFCITCHQRSGVTMSGPIANFAGRSRFHPPKQIWTDGPRASGHHAWEAQRNLGACVSCHTERDCATCHATAAMGGRGSRPGSDLSPHPTGFISRCGLALRKNARPCLVCHDPSDPNLGRCK